MAVGAYCSVRMPINFHALSSLTGATALSVLADTFAALQRAGITVVAVVNDGYSAFLSMQDVVCAPTSPHLRQAGLDAPDGTAAPAVAIPNPFCGGLPVVQIPDDDHKVKCAAGPLWANEANPAKKMTLHGKPVSIALVQTWWDALGTTPYSPHVNLTKAHLSPTPSERMNVALAVQLLVACSEMRGLDALTEPPATPQVAAAAPIHAASPASAPAPASAFSTPPAPLAVPAGSTTALATTSSLPAAAANSHDADLVGVREWGRLIRRWYEACTSTVPVKSSDVVGPNAHPALVALLACVREMDALLASGALRNPPRQFIREFRQSCHGMLLLSRLLVRPEHNLYIVLRRVTQTVLEQFFGRVRGAGDAGLGGPSLTVGSYMYRRAALAATAQYSGAQTGGSYSSKVQRAERSGGTAPSRVTSDAHPLAYVPDGGKIVRLGATTLPVQERDQGGSTRSLAGALALL